MRAWSATALFATCLLMAACSSATRIVSDGAARVVNLAGEIRDDTGKAVVKIKEGTANLALPFLGSVDQKAAEIQQTGAEVQAAVPDLQDRVSPWVKLLQTWGWVLLIAAMIGGLMYLGLGPILRKIVAGFGFFIPTVTANEAKLDAETVASHQAAKLPIPTEQVRRMEARKTADPAYRAAFKKHITVLNTLPPPAIDPLAASVISNTSSNGATP